MPTPFAWAPSAERVIPLFGQSTGSPSDNAAAALPLRWPDMPAGGMVDYGLDCTAVLAGGDTIAGFTIGAGALQLVASMQLAGVVYVWLSGTVSGTDYPVAITVTSAAGRTINRVVRLMAL